MKNLMFHLTAVLVLTTVLFFSFDTNVKASEIYIGEFCWEATGIFPTPEYYNFGVFQKDGGHYALYGTSQTTTPEVDSTFNGTAHGNAEIIGNNVMMTIVFTYYNEDFEWWNGGTLGVNLDKDTLNGQLYMLSN